MKRSAKSIEITRTNRWAANYSGMPIKVFDDIKREIYPPNLRTDTLCISNVVAWKCVRIQSANLKLKGRVIHWSWTLKKEKSYFGFEHCSKIVRVFICTFSFKKWRTTVVVSPFKNRPYYNCTVSAASDLSQHHNVLGTLKVQYKMYNSSLYIASPLSTMGITLSHFLFYFLQVFKLHLCIHYALRVGIAWEHHKI